MAQESHHQKGKNVARKRSAATTRPSAPNTKASGIDHRRFGDRGSGRSRSFDAFRRRAHNWTSHATPQGATIGVTARPTPHVVSASISDVTAPTPKPNVSDSHSPNGSRGDPRHVHRTSRAPAWTNT